MPENDAAAELLVFFKALADRNRLTIVGILAQGPRPVEELASALKVGASTVSHHLGVLARAGLVEAKAKGYYSIYSLVPGVLEGTAKRLLHRKRLSVLAEEASGDAFDRKVLAAFTDERGRIKTFPVHERKYRVLLRYVLREFTPGVRYTEKRVNEMLSRFSDDTAQLRRSLVEHRFMAREGGGGKYWRTGEA